MDKFIVFATIFFQGEVKQLEYKAIDFSSKKECYEYMTKHDKHFGEVVGGSAQRALDLQNHTHTRARAHTHTHTHTHR